MSTSSPWIKRLRPCPVGTTRCRTCGRTLATAAAPSGPFLTHHCDPYCAAAEESDR